MLTKIPDPGQSVALYNAQLLQIQTRGALSRIGDVLRAQTRAHFVQDKMLKC